MTREEFTRMLPAYTFDRMPSKPPFEFKGLSARIFPLRASLNALQQLCNRYLNFAPREVGSFRAAVPYVYLALLEYGQISELLSNLGWFAQKEVFFGVPVEWYKVVNGRWVFHDWALITPYIYVNDDFSAPMGRTVFGYPKILARVTPSTSQWWSDPFSPTTVARVETAVFPELYEGKRLEPRVFLEVEHDAPTSNLRIPADPSSLIAPWVIASNLAQAMAGFGRDAMWLAQSMRMFPVNAGTNPAFLGAMLEQVAADLAPGGTGFVLNSLNLKQFRRSDDPASICYQALTNGRMQMLALDGGGPLGEQASLLGDLSGGYTIKLHEYSSLAIARTLGLEVQRRWRGDGVDVISLKPVMPFWLKGNTLFQPGINLAWRTDNGIWRGGDGQPLDPSQEQAKQDAAPPFNTTVVCAVDAVVGPFQFTGTTVRVLPLLADRNKLKKFLDDNINAVFGDRADYKLSLWARPEIRVKKDGPQIQSKYAYVYLTASSLGEVTSKTNNVGDWARYELSFLIPVKWKRRGKDGKWTLEGVGLVPAYTFVDDSTAAISRTEALGIPTSCAKFVRPESVWLSEDEDDLGAKQTVLRVDAEVIPALGVGQQAAIHPVIEVRARDDDGLGELNSRVTPGEWAAILRLELETKKAIKAQFSTQCNAARALALELLGNRVPVSLYTLKQFRDVSDPGKACYQELVRVSRVFEEVVDVREIEETVRVRLHDYPTLKLVEELGIFAKPTSEAGTGLIYDADAIRPFYIRATIGEALGETLISRAGTLEWEIGSGVVQSLLSDRGPAIMVDGQAERVQDRGDPCRMNSIMHQSAQRRRTDGKARPSGAELSSDEEKELRRVSRLDSSGASARDREDRRTELKKRSDLWEEWRLRQGMTKTAAREALSAVDPQMVIESILSREWGNFDENARWRVGRQKLLEAREIGLSSGSGGSASFAALKIPGEAHAVLEEAIRWGRVQFASVEAALYRAVRDEKAHHSGSPRLNEEPEVDAAIDRMQAFTAHRLEMEDHFSILAAWSISRWSSKDLGSLLDQTFTDEKVREVSGRLVVVMREISNLDVIGEPSKRSDTQVLNDWIRLVELLEILEKEFPPPPASTKKASENPRDDAEANYARAQRMYETAKKLQGFRVETAGFQDDGATQDAWRLIDQFREAVHLARNYCNAQRGALLNKLSRAYQKPDFCIRRDSVGPESDHLLPTTLSWDEHWYYGEKPEDKE